MITSFEVGAIFRILDEASPALRTLLRQIRELNKAIEGARANLSGLMKSINVSIEPAVAETRALAAEWRAVSVEAQAARRAISSAAAANALPSVPRVSLPGRGGGGGGRGGGVHVSSLSAPLPGGHARIGGLGNAGLAGAGMLAYGVYQAAEMDDAVFNTLFHAGLPYDDKNKKRFRDIIQQAASDTGMPIRDIQTAVNDEIRMFRGTDGNGLDVLPEMLRAAATEARAKGKGTTVDEAMESLIGLAHMTKQYSPEEIRKLAPVFGFLSSSTAATLPQIERAAGYAVPILRSGMEVDPMQTLLMGIALQRAGITNTKSGTWIRNMALNALPGTSLMSKIAFKRHEEALSALGLIDKKNNPTWFTDGKPDLIKMMQVASEHAQKIPLVKRAAYEKALFGAQGFGGFAVLSDPMVMEQMRALLADIPGFKQRYGTFFQDYNQHSTAQLARQSFADMQNVLMDIGSVALPPVTAALRDFDRMLKKLKGALPDYKSPGGGPSLWDTATKRAVEFAAPGALLGAGLSPFVAGAGAIPGAVLGGIVGAGEGSLEHFLGFDKEYQSEVAKTGDAAKGAVSGLEQLRRAIDGLSGGMPSYVPPPPGTKGLQHHSSIYLDGRKVGEAVLGHINDRAGMPTEGSRYHDTTWHAAPLDYSLSTG